MATRSCRLRGGRSEDVVFQADQRPAAHFLLSIVPLRICDSTDGNRRACRRVISIGQGAGSTIFWSLIVNQYAFDEGSGWQ